MSLDRAIEAAAEALTGGFRIASDAAEVMARIAVEAAAPYLAAVEILTVKDGKQAIVAYTNWRQRAEQAEAKAAGWEETARLYATNVENAEALADRLAEAIRPYVEGTVPSIKAAFAAWEGARRD